MNATRLNAPAKLTWYLEVTARRPDGYHEIRSEMVSLDLADALDVEPADVTEVTVVANDDERLALTVSAEDNLVTRALSLVGKRARVRIDKRIPVGGGLGGGSSDAGAVLRWAGFDDFEAASTLGGDVPFCVHGGRALVEGIGERITELDHVARRVTLAVPDFGVNTAACYRAFDDLVAGGWRREGRNHLRRAAELVEPRLASLAKWLGAETGQSVELCGSGSTLFVEGWVREQAGSWEVKGPEGRLRLVTATTTPREAL